MRISDWSSDVYSSDLEPMLWDAHSPHGLIHRDAQPWTVLKAAPTPRERDLLILADQGIGDIIQQWRYVDSVAEQFRRARVCCRPELRRLLGGQIGRASCRERVWQYV